MSGGLDLRELESFLVLSEELHFGRTAERLYVTQSRVSQLLRTLERRIGGRLFERTSRRVRLTPLGERMLAELKPAYDGLHGAVASARAAARGVEGVLRVGFLSGSGHEHVIGRIGAFQERHPDCEVVLSEVSLSDPFGAVRRGELDAAILTMPVDEPDLVVGPLFNAHRQTVAVSARSPLAGRPSLDAEDLAECPVLDIDGPAPAYWREAMTPTHTPEGRPIPRGPGIRTLQEALAAIAADRGAMLVCAPTACDHERRDIAYVALDGLPDSRLGLVWHRDGETERLRAFGAVLAEPT